MQDGLTFTLSKLARLLKYSHLLNLRVTLIKPGRSRDTFLKHTLTYILVLQQRVRRSFLSGTTKRDLRPLPLQCRRPPRDRETG